MTYSGGVGVQICIISMLPERESSIPPSSYSSRPSVVLTDTEVAPLVVRVVAAEAYRVIRLDGVDPFSKDRKVFVTRPLDRQTDLAIPRAQFADHPSTEFRFFRTQEDATAGRPALTVFYLGVPDTTPEFAAQRDAETYLDGALRPK